ALTPGQEKSVESAGSPPFTFAPTLFANSAQIAQTPQSDLFATNQRLTVVSSDGPTPIAGAIAQVIKQRGPHGGTARGELRLVAGNGFHFGFEMPRNIHNK